MEIIPKFEKEYLPMFRDSDAQGLIGMRAYLYYFQDMSTEHLHLMGKGNDTLPERYGMAWIYTKYRLRILKRADYSRPLHMETWIEKQDKIRLWQDLKITAGSDVYALGRLESCVINLEKQKIGMLSDIEMPPGTNHDEKIEQDPFTRMKPEEEGMEYMYSHRVLYSDLDKSHHMANLRYVNLMENAFTPDFYSCHEVKEMELHYTTQSSFGDEIRIYKKDMGDCYQIAGKKEDGTTVFLGIMKF